jgi:hypothetical protein
MKTRSRTRPPERDDAVVVKSDDGAVAFELRPTDSGLCVHRERLQLDGRARLAHTAVFREAECFIRWCEADSVRFDYPRVSSEVKRRGQALLECHERPRSTKGDRKGR